MRQAIDYSKYRFGLLEFLKYLCLGIAIAALFSYVFYRHIYAFFILSLFSLVFPFYQKKLLIKKRKKQLEVEFKEGILTLASLISAGYSAENALKESIEELKLVLGEKSLIAQEFEYLSHLVYMNIPIEKAFEDLGERSQIDDIRNFARVIRIAKRSGGELIGIINYTAGIISDKMKIKEEILTLTTAKRFEQKIMNLFPFIMVLYIETSSPGFFRTMYITILGRILMSFCLAGYLFALYLSSKILDIQV